MITPSTSLKRLHDTLKAEGFNLWFVGGCVRDSIMGVEPKDIDLCTDANPDEQLAIYKKHRIRHFETGLHHGTLTVRTGGVAYEITSLRTESDHDGRHATVAYTRSLTEDLSRRDLTINAMAQDFEGNLIDPFGGLEDVRQRKVRFVGDAAERMKEDYLRILRYFRFQGRFASADDLDAAATWAVKQNKQGLFKISRERIWQEMQKIVVGPQADAIVWQMKRLGVLDCLYGYENISDMVLHVAQIMRVDDPAITMGLILPKEDVEYYLSENVLSNDERARVRFANDYLEVDDIEVYRELLVFGKPLAWVEQMLRFHELPSLSDWVVPVFPVDGNILIKQKGLKPGPKFGETLKTLKAIWKASNYTMTREQLLALV